MLVEVTPFDLVKRCSYREMLEVRKEIQHRLAILATFPPVPYRGENFAAWKKYSQENSITFLEVKQVWDYQQETA